MKSLDVLGGEPEVNKGSRCSELHWEPEVKLMNGSEGRPDQFPEHHQKEALSPRLMRLRS